MNRAVVDTDVLSFYFKSDSRFERYASELEGKQLIVSFMTLAELQLWQEIKNWGDRRRNALKQILDEQFVIYPVDKELCNYWASLTAEAIRSGRVLKSSDAWIAATAVKLGAPLVSHNGKDFEYLSNLQLISKPD